MKPFARLATLLLALIAALQSVRFAAGWPVTVNGIDIPVWISALFAAIAGGLALMLWRESRH